MVTSVLPYTADTAGYRQALGSPRNATPRNSKPLSKANVLSSMSRITRILSPICGQTQLHLAELQKTQWTHIFFKTTGNISNENPMRVQMLLKLLPDILARCYTVGSSRWPLHCEAGCCRPGSSPSSGRRCPAGPRSPGTAWTPASWQCLSLPLCQEGPPTRSPRRASLPRSRSCHAHRPCSGRWGCGAGWSRSSSRKHCGSSHGSSDRVGRPWAVQGEKTGTTDSKKLT